VTTGTRMCWFKVSALVSYWFNVALLAMYVKVSKAGRRSWHGWLGETLNLNDAKVYLKLAISSTVMTL
jgi:multidrug resistance protein, MATE family